MEPSGSLRFIADAMLGRLTRWLRVLGYDTLYSPSWGNGDLARLAGAERRILLTRDRELARRRGFHAILLDSDQVDEQLHQLFQELPLASNSQHFGRCLRCNAPLEQLTKDELPSSVPPYVARTQKQFRYCTSCRRIYWQGTHWQRMLAKIERLIAESHGHS